MGVAAILLAPSAALADPAADAPQRPSNEGQTEGKRWEVGAGITGAVMHGGKSIGTFSLGLDAWYRPFENVAFGVELQRFASDLGADPQYCYGCVYEGTFAAAFVEGRLVPKAIVSPFLRVGAGAGFLEVNGASLDAPGDRSEVHPLLVASAGPQLTLWHVFLRLRGTLTATPPAAYAGFGAELGGVF